MPFVLVSLPRVLLATSAALLLAGAAAADELSGTAAVHAKRTAEGIVFLSTGPYRVTGETALRDADGRALGLVDLEVPDLAAGEKPPPLAPLIARFEASRRGEDLVLRSLDILRPD